MPLACSKEALVWLFLHTTSAFKLVFFFSFLLFAFTFRLLCSLFGQRYEYEEEEEDDDMHEALVAMEDEEEEESVFEYYNSFRRSHDSFVLEEDEEEDELGFRPHTILSKSTSSSDDPSRFEDPDESFQVIYPQSEEDEEEEGGHRQYEEEVIVEDITEREDTYLDENFEPLYKNKCPSPRVKIIHLGQKQDSLAPNIQTLHEEQRTRSVEIEPPKAETKLSRDEFLIYAASRGETQKQPINNIALTDHHKRHVIIDDHRDHDEPYADSCTVGSTSKDSSDWRSSFTFRDSCTDDPFSSSSRRSCPKWESYTMFQKYDEEMTFLDRISAQKLQETESLKSLHVQPRSISQRFVHQFTSTTIQEVLYQSTSNNPYHELEAAYVAQVCLAWEALSWDYNNFRRKQSLLRQQGTSLDLGCPAHVAQQFQQFYVLLQRYVESEPYEYGKRPEIYARMRRSVSPKLLVVPEYQDYEDDQKEKQGRIPSEIFLGILEDSVRTFMSFVRADRENPYHVVLKSLLRKKTKKGAVDPALVKVLKKANTKKKMKLKELRRSKNCMRKNNLTKVEEMEILMGLIDLKLVSRVLRMWDLTHEKLRWCEEKMTKLSLSKQGKLQRDSTPLFFPAH